MMIERLLPSSLLGHCEVQKDKKIIREDDYGVWQRLYFQWMNGVLYSTKKELDYSDLPVLPHQNGTFITRNKLLDCMNRTRRSDGTYNLRKALLFFTSPLIWYSIPLKFIYDVCNYGQTLLLKWMIGIVQEMLVSKNYYETEKEVDSMVFHDLIDKDESNTRAFLLFTLAFGFINVFQSSILQRYFHNQNVSKNIGFHFSYFISKLVYDFNQV